MALSDYIQTFGQHLLGQHGERIHQIALDALYRQAMTQHDIVGLSVGTRPDCVSGKVLDLLAGYRDEGRIVWLELGLQSAFDETLRRVNRGHGLKEYREVAVEARGRGLPLGTPPNLGLAGAR